MLGSQSQGWIDQGSLGATFGNDDGFWEVVNADGELDKTLVQESDELLDMDVGNDMSEWSF